MSFTGIGGGTVPAAGWTRQTRKAAGATAGGVCSPIGKEGGDFYICVIHWFLNSE